MLIKVFICIVYVIFHYLYAYRTTLVLLFIARTNFSEFSDDWHEVLEKTLNLLRAKSSIFKITKLSTRN